MLVLVVFEPVQPALAEGIDALAAQFAGEVVRRREDDAAGIPEAQTAFLCGNTARAVAAESAARRTVLVEGLCSDDEASAALPRVGLGKVPISVHGLGVYYRRFFDAGLFQQITAAHEFQHLTESNKPDKALRTGLYLSDVAQDADGLHFRLLRCSSNFTGPTENLRDVDRRILGELNDAARMHFEGAHPLNHVLAQIYHNMAATQTSKAKKASIARHSDKTKDMPPNAIMAFCTFYTDTDHLKPSKTDPFDLVYGAGSATTRLRFRRKPDVDAPELPETFEVPLFPDSAFLIGLDTNRMYTHEIRPAVLQAEQLPTRMGYVVRCSKTEAVSVDGQTFIKRNGERFPLHDPTEDDVKRLRAVYLEENSTAAKVDYGIMDFSLNRGDYSPPNL